MRTARRPTATGRRAKPRWPRSRKAGGGNTVASACPDYDRRNAIFDGRACVRQIAILTVQLVGHIAACSADPAVIEPAEDELLAVSERDNVCRFINPEAQVLFDARRSTSSRRVHDDYFFC